MFIINTNIVGLHLTALNNIKGDVCNLNIFEYIYRCRPIYIIPCVFIHVFIQAGFLGDFNPPFHSHSEVIEIGRDLVLCCNTLNCRWFSVWTRTDP